MHAIFFFEETCNGWYLESEFKYSLYLLRCVSKNKRFLNSISFYINPKNLSVRHVGWPDIARLNHSTSITLPKLQNIYVLNFKEGCNAMQIYPTCALLRLDHVIFLYNVLRTHNDALPQPPNVAKNDSHLRALECP